MRKTSSKPSADEIAEMADMGKSVTSFFTNRGKMKLPPQRVNVDFSPEMLHELDEVACGLNISRQAVIKTYLRNALDQHYIATKGHSRRRVKKERHAHA